MDSSVLQVKFYQIFKASVDVTHFRCALKCTVATVIALGNIHNYFVNQLLTMNIHSN